MTTYLLPYTTGTASVSNGSTAVTGTLTAWLANVKAGDRFRIGSTENIVASVESNTALTLLANWGGSTVSGSAYSVDRYSRGWFSGGDLALQLALYNSNRPTFIATIGAPSNSVGADGNIAVDSTVPASPVIYTKSGGAWSAGTTIGIGPQGIQGVPGSSGHGLLINGDFQINQRGFAGGALGATIYGYDRWRGYASGATISVSGYTVTLTGRIGQIVEPAIMAGVSSLASTQLTFSVENPSGDIVVIAGSASGTITAGSGRRSATITTGAGDSGNLTIALDTTVATTFQKLKVELGPSATAWQPRPRQQELRLAQRYYQKSARLATTPGEGNSYTLDCYFGPGVGVVTGQAMYASPVQFATPMRTTPTLTFLRSSLGTIAGRWQIYIGGSWVDATHMSTGSLTEQGFCAAPFHGSIVAGTGYNCTGGWVANAEL